MNRTYKLGHNAPVPYKINRFNSIEIDGDWAYCLSHNFVYNTEVEDEKLHNGLPCYYTDARFVSGQYNYYKNTMLFWNRRKPISLKACIRRTMKCKNIPKGTIVEFNQNWYYPKTRIINTYCFKVKKENNIDIEYEVTKKGYSQNFTSCEFSQKLTKALRDNGFLVYVKPNTSFILDMFNHASSHVGSSNFIDSKINGEMAVAYGHGKRIGFSSYNDDYNGYSCGRDNILWDWGSDFNKWSQCFEIEKTSSIDEILEILIMTRDEFEK